MTYPVGQSAVIVAVPDAEPIVGGWRARFDADAASTGFPAHLTIVYPFLPAPSLSLPVLRELRAIVARHSALRLTFARTARFPGVLYLEPSPDDPVRALIHDVFQRWPEAPPYGGEFGDPTPHLTVAVGGRDKEAEQAVTARLPFTTVLTEAQVIIFDGHRWNVAERLPFRTK